MIYRGPDPDINAATFYGIFHADGTPKRSALAFSLWSELVAHLQALNITLSGPNGLWILAGQNTQGETAILFANPSDRPATLTLLGTDGKPIEAAARQMVSDGSESIQESMGGAQVQVPAYAVMLVIIQ